MKEKVEHNQCVLCALLCPGPCFPSSPEEMQRCFWNVILDNSGYQVTFHLAIQTGWMSQQKGRLEVGERGKTVEESRVKSKVMTRGAYGSKDLEIGTQQVQLLHQCSSEDQGQCQLPYGNFQHFLIALARGHHNSYL